MIADVFGYREWARELRRLLQIEVSSRPETADWLIHWHGREALEPCREATAVFLVGWSWVVPPDFYESRPVFVLHPSPLPRYRGGSPLQHQILAGESESAVTVFRLDAEHPAVDSGPIAGQVPLSLSGELPEILGRIAEVGALEIVRILRLLRDGSLTLWEQDESRATTFKRRTPAESEITPAELAAKPGRWLADKVRALADPYPNAFVQTADGGRLHLLKTRFEEAEKAE